MRSDDLSKLIRQDLLSEQCLFCCKGGLLSYTMIKHLKSLRRVYAKLFLLHTILKTIKNNNL